MAMMATAERSMPRPMMTIAMPTARMPSTETLRTIDTTLAVVRKPGKPMAATTNRATAIARTIRSWSRRAA